MSPVPPDRKAGDYTNPNWRGDEEARIFEWRLRELERAGWPREDAEQLAGEPSVDLHLAVRLLARGCSRAVALRILL